MTTRHETLLETELRQALTPVGEPGPALKARICGAAAANPPRRRISRLALIAAVAAVFLLTATVAYALFSDKDFRRELAADYDIATFCSTEDTIYFSQMAYTADKRQISLIYFADRATGITAPLCGKPECDHTGSGCNAYVQDFIYGLAVYDGQLYAASASGPIWRMNMDGTDRQLVRTIDSEILYADGGSSGQVWFHRGYAYSLSNFYTISGGEDIEGVKEYAVSLTDPDEPPVIILHEKYPGKAVYDHYHLVGDYLYISLGLYDWEELNLQEENAEKPAYEFENDFTIYRWDMQSRTLETVYHDASTTLSINDMWAMEDGLLMEGYYGGDLGVYWLDFATGQITRRFALDEGWLFSGFADNMVITEGWDPQPQVKTYRVLDFDGNVLLETRFDVPAGAANATEEDVKANRSDWWGNSTFGADEEYLYGAFNHYASEDDGNGHVLEGTAEEGIYFYEVSLETGECRFIGQNISKQ